LRVFHKLYRQQHSSPGTQIGGDFLANLLKLPSQGTLNQGEESLGLNFKTPEGHRM